MPINHCIPSYFLLFIFSLITTPLHLKGMESSTSITHIENKNATTEEKTDEIRHFLTNPIPTSHQGLVQLVSFDEQFKKILKGQSSIEQKLKNIKYLHTILQQQHPTYLLQECTRFGSSCRVNRLHNNNRKIFEQKISSLLIQAIDESLNRPVDYIHFGNGEMLPLLLILTKTLEITPSAHIRLHLINPLYEQLLEARHQARKAARLTKTINLKNFVSSLLPYCIELPETTFKQIIYSLSVERFRLGQLRRWITRYYPDNHLKIYIHGSFEHYEQCRDINSCPSSSIMTAIDLLHSKTPWQDYPNASKRLLSINPAAQILELKSSGKNIEYVSHLSEIVAPTFPTPTA